MWCFLSTLFFSNIFAIFIFIYFYFFCVDNNNIAWAQKKKKKILSTVWSKCDPYVSCYACLRFYDSKTFFLLLFVFLSFSNGGKCEKETVETKATHKYELREEPTCCKKYKIKERHVVSVCVCVLPAWKTKM